MEKEKLVVSPSWMHYCETGHAVMNVMIRPGHGKIFSIFLVIDTFSNWIPKLKLLGVEGCTPTLQMKRVLTST